MAIDLVPRDEWGARPPKGGYSPLPATKGVKVHYTGGLVDPDIVHEHDRCVAMVRSIQSFHMDGNGWLDIGYCADEETEILTRQGWKSYRELREGDIALTLNHATGMSEWQPVLEVCVFPATERRMIAMFGDGHSSLTTPHHRWPVVRVRAGTRGDGRPVAAGESDGCPRAGRLWVTTETIGRRDRIPTAAPCADLPTEPKWSDALVELIAWFCAEGLGATRPACSVVIRQAARDAANVSRIRTALVEVLGPEANLWSDADRPPDDAPRWREGGNGPFVEFQLSAAAGRRLLEIAPGRVPSHPFLLSLTRAQLMLFIETSLAAGNAGAGTLARTDLAAAEAFMFAVLLSGGTATLRRRPSGRPSGTDRWLVGIPRRHHVAPRSVAGSRFVIAAQQYRGEIWCPRTANQSWLARRDGTVYFTGNTMVACPHRKVFMGRGPRHLPAANGPGLNSGHYAVLGLVGNAGLVHPPDGILHGILDAIEYLREHGNAGREIKGHRDGYSTDCPGDPLYSWVRHGAPRPGAEEPHPQPRPAPGPTPEWPGRLLRYPPPTNGADVRAWQAQMKRLGYQIVVDGSYGPGSRAVCVRFQRDAHLDPDGVVGPLTWNAAFAVGP